MAEEKHKARTIAINTIARVEGEGALRVTVTDGLVQDVELRIFEPPRFFEAFLQGRHYDEVADIVARICGICPVAYQMSAVHALEQIFGVEVTGSLRDLRRLIYCGEWIESHALHVYMLQAPDFLGYDSGIAMAKDHRGYGHPWSAAQESGQCHHDVAGWPFRASRLGEGRRVFAGAAATRVGGSQRRTAVGARCGGGDGPLGGRL